MRRVRIAATVRGAFDFATDLRVAAGCAGAWSLVLLAMAVIDWALDPQLRWVGQLGAAPVAAIAFAGMAVNVHRRVLLGENPRLLRMGRREMAYIWRELVLAPFIVVAAFILILLYFLGSYLLAMGFVGRILAGLLCACVAVFLVVEFVGCLLVFPAAAINRAGFRWSDSWEVAEGNKFAILLVAVICAMPLALPALALVAVEPWLAARPVASLAAEVARWMIHVAQLTLDAAWLSLVFSGLVDGNPEFSATSTTDQGNT
jgi:hypothetical protein